MDAMGLLAIYTSDNFATSRLKSIRVNRDSSSGVTFIVASWVNPGLLLARFRITAKRDVRKGSAA